MFVFYWSPKGYLPSAFDPCCILGAVGSRSAVSRGEIRFYSPWPETEGRNKKDSKKFQMQVPRTLHRIMLLLMETTQEPVKHTTVCLTKVGELKRAKSGCNNHCKLNKRNMWVSLAFIICFNHFLFSLKTPEPLWVGCDVSQINVRSVRSELTHSGKLLEDHMLCVIRYVLPSYGVFSGPLTT